MDPETLLLATLEILEATEDADQREAALAALFADEGEA